MYPLKFVPILKPTIWGGERISSFKNIESTVKNVGESWEISQLKSDISVVSEGELKGKSLVELIEIYQDQLLGKHVYQQYGMKFPLLIKLIDANDSLSIQVHPDDRLASARHNSMGKTEMWYVVDAEPGATLYSGFSQQITRDEYVECVQNNTITDVLQAHPVKKGDVFFLPAGRVHAIGKGIFIAEIQQNSDITYRIYDYDRRDKQGHPRELHTELAKDAINYTLCDDYKMAYEPVPNQEVKLVACNYFVTSLLKVNKKACIDVASRDSFISLMCMSGEANLIDDKQDRISIRQGETVLLPASLSEVQVEGQASFLLSYIPD